MKKILYRLAKLLPKILYKNISYSQDGEDMVLRSFYENEKNYKGFYVDIGAHHPYRFSNTAYFYKKGWRGINIEATPTLIKSFKKYRKKDINLNIGISDIASTLTFYIFNEPALNSFNKELSLQRHNDITKYKIIEEKQIQTNTLEAVLDNYLPTGKKIDFFTIDVEGLDLEVLKSNNWDKYKPLYILVEHEFDCKNITNTPIFNYLTNLNYNLVARTKRTSIFELISQKNKIDGYYN